MESWREVAKSRFFSDEARGSVSPSDSDEDLAIPFEQGRAEIGQGKAELETEIRRSVLEPELRRALAGADDQQMVRSIVYLRATTDVREATMASASIEEAGVELISALEATADRTQAPLRSYLAEEQAGGRVLSYQPFWITNAIAVHARPSVIRTLAAHPAVSTVHLDHWRQWVSETREGARSWTSQPRPAPHHALTDPGLTTSVGWNVSRVRADEVWHALSISGTGAVVASIDTGVDWLHPALRESYRGYNPHGPAEHVHNWFDATGAGALYPVDGHGHGSHTLGTMVGQGGIGVAPGARWIAVRMLNNHGYGYDSWIHAGFQWVLAPEDDPSRAPDVINCSWGSENAYLTTFQEDLRALRAAGVLPVFASGNDGPGRGSMDSPASLPEAFAVGAVDNYGDVAGFSGRGPSPWGEIRPHVVAPGVHVSSSTPGGAYEMKQGTSMAAPHASGIAAMLRSVSPTLSITKTVHLITSTAVGMGEQIPNNDSGWGRVDAFAAVAALVRPGFITGSVRRGSDPASGAPLPLAGATVSAEAHGGGGGGRDITGPDGVYRLALAPGTYDLRVSAFGYRSATRWGLPVVTETTTVEDITLTPQPTGSLRVRVSDASTGQLITATVGVLGSPYEVVTHTHTFDLPANTYTVRAHRPEYRVVTASVAITVGQTVAVDLALSEGPSILLVDSGGWYYESEIPYFRQALDDLSYSYDEWSIRNLPEDVPRAADLTPYDIVVWSAPRDAPGYIGAGNAVGAYLEGGGRLLLSGQDVGYWDGGGNPYQQQPYYYRDYLKVWYLDDNATSRVLVGERGDIFSGQTITIAGPGGADNQSHPDVISVADEDAAAPVLRYQGDGCGGARVGTCLDYRAIYLPFGFEAINQRPDRRELMRATLHWLTASPPRAGLELKPQANLGIGRPGSRVTHTIRLRHIGQGGEPDQISLELRRPPGGAGWPTELSDSSLTLSPCASTTITIGVTIPATATWDLRDVVRLTARSSLSPTVTVSATLETKAPASILLVDDDRWYDQQLTYRMMMEDAGLAYDVWETTLAGGGHGPAPSSETLQRYPVVVWWTGYDWYAPVTREEQASLAAYLDGGGRLMLSSQDFLYHHHDEPFARTHLGVLTYTEDITPTHVTGVSENLVWPCARCWGRLTT
jgi:hypothetical protein